MAGTRERLSPRGGIPDGQERPCLSHRRRGWRRRLVDRGELREDQRAERAAHLDLFVVSERDPRWPCLAPDPRRPRCGPFSRRRPGRRRVPEPADDGRSPGPSQRRRRDRLRHRRDEARSDQTPGEGPPPGHPSSEEGAEPLPERADAEHSRPRRGRPAVRPGLPTRRERLQGYLGRQEAGDRTAEHPSRETRGRRGRRDGRFPELRTGVSERAQVSDDRERSDLSWCARRRREVPRAVSDDAGIVDPPLDGLPWPSAWCRRQAGRGRARRDEHGGRRGLRGGALDDRHVGRRILPDGRGDRAGRDDGDPVGRDPRAAQRSVDRIANEDGARGPEPRPWCGPGRLAARDPGAPQPGRMLPPHRAGLQPRGNLSDADHRDLGSLPGRRLPHGREAGLQRPDRPRHVRGERRGGEGLQAIPPHGERRESSGDFGPERISVRRRDGRAHGEQRAHLRRPRRDPGIRHRAQSDAREADAEARRSAEGHAAPGALGTRGRGPYVDPLGVHLGRRPRGDPERRGTRNPGEQPGVPDPVPVPYGRDARPPQGRETEPRNRGQLHRPVHAAPPLGDRLQAGPLLREIRWRALYLERHRGQDPGGGRMKLEFEMDTYKSEIKPTWCPGCGDFAVLRALQMAIHTLQLEPWNVVIVSGIGCSSNLPHFLSTYGFHAIHGRALPVAEGVKLANPDLQVIVTGGDGDGYGIGVGHFIHAMRRNIDITYLVMNNQIYGLTTGQASPTSEKGMKTKSTPIEGVIENPVDPISLALASGATYVARAFSGDVKGMAELVKNGIEHHGFSLIDCMSPCVTYTKVNTYDFFRERVYDLQKDGHDPSDMKAAFAKAIEWPFVGRDRIPLGLFYRTEKVPTYEDLEPALKKGSPVRQPLGVEDPDELLSEFL